MCTKKKVSKKGFVYTARQNGSFSRVIPEQCTEKRPYRVVCLYTVAVCKPGRNELTGAENETRTIPYNALITNDLEEVKKTSGETKVKLSWLFRTYRGSDVKRHGKNVSCHEVP
jgi:hypothetical protein